MPAIYKYYLNGGIIVRSADIIVAIAKTKYSGPSPLAADLVGAKEKGHQAHTAALRLLPLSILQRRWSMFRAWGRGGG